MLIKINKLGRANVVTDGLLWLRMSQAFKAEEAPESKLSTSDVHNVRGGWTQVNNAPGIERHSFPPALCPI